jgi:Tfp pilus assembly protein FimT
MQDLIAIAIIAGLCLAIAVREARLRRRIKDLSASLYLARARADRVDESNRIMDDKLKQIAKEREDAKYDDH